VALAAVIAVWLTRDMVTVSGAFIAFTAGLALWGWHEVSFLTGMRSPARAARIARPMTPKAGSGSDTPPRR
jgi:hypothetical protein